MLVFGWLLLLVAIIFQLLALSSSHEATREQINILDKQYAHYLAADDPEEAARTGWEEPLNKFNSRVNKYNLVAQIALISGVVLVLAFSASNISYKKGGDDERKQKTAKSQATTSKDKGQAIQGKLYSPEGQASSTASAKER